jgi:prepilin-type N-terminal cleavage/methylation domain-containing protein
LRTERTRGFTLIEVLVSLAIAAIGMAFFLSATGVGLQNTGIADQSIQATRLAQSHLAAVGFSVPLRQGSYSGDDGLGFRWQVRVSAPLAHPHPAGGQISPGASSEAPSRVLYPVEVGESWQSGFSHREIVLRSERLGAP